jgi:hypothetical protein
MTSLAAGEVARPIMTSLAAGEVARPIMTSLSGIMSGILFEKKKL